MEDSPSQALGNKTYQTQSCSVSDSKTCSSNKSTALTYPLQASLQSVLSIHPNQFLSSAGVAFLTNRFTKHPTNNNNKKKQKQQKPQFEPNCSSFRFQITLNFPSPISTLFQFANQITTIRTYINTRCMSDTNGRVTHSQTCNSAQKQGYPYAPKKNPNSANEQNMQCRAKSHLPPTKTLEIKQQQNSPTPSTKTRKSNSNSSNWMAYQNPKSESPNPGPKHHCRVEQREANITPLHQFKPPLFCRILCLRTLNFEIRSRWEEIKTEVPKIK